MKSYLHISDVFDHFSDTCITRQIARAPPRRLGHYFAIGDEKELDNEKWQPNFDDHLETVKQYIQAVQEMTDAHIYWESMTAMLRTKLLRIHCWGLIVCDTCLVIEQRIFMMRS